MTLPYFTEDGNAEYFGNSAFLVWNNRLVALLFALFMLWLRGEPMKNIAPFHYYSVVALSNVAATFCQYEALKYLRHIHFILQF
jgi:adenosine 3'-phospho 5'-phosphosulfate transporter B2